MIRPLSFAAILLVCSVTTATAGIIGHNPYSDEGQPDRWSAVSVMYGYRIPAGQRITSVNYGASADRADGTRYIQPLIARERDGDYSIWAVGPVETPMGGGSSISWISSTIPNDGYTYHPAIWQWADGVDDTNGGTIPYAASGGRGMFQSNRNGMSYVPLVGESLDIEYASGAGGRAYQMHFVTVPEPSTAEEVMGHRQHRPLNPS